MMQSFHNVPVLEKVIPVAYGVSSHSFSSMKPDWDPFLVVSGARAIYEREVPETQEQALGRKRESFGPSNTQTLKSHTRKELSSKEEWETGNMIFVLTFGS